MKNNSKVEEYTIYLKTEVKNNKLLIYQQIGEIDFSKELKKLTSKLKKCKK